jgi:hypothetical protein
MNNKHKEKEEIFAGNFSELLTDFAVLANEVKSLKMDNRKLMEKLYELEKKQLRPSANSADIDYIINRAVKTAIEKTNSRNYKTKTDFVKKFERRKKEFIKQKILELAESRRYTVSEIKEVIVDKECYCSKASFYRYIEKLRWKGNVDFVDIEERRIIVPRQIKVQ